MALSRQYDNMFLVNGAPLPVPYLRALSYRESGMNPASKGASAWGILQVTEVVRNDYNARYGATWARESLLQADVCTMIAADLLKRIVLSYKNNHGAVGNMGEDWSNPRFVELVTFGWNAGYSQAGGVGRVVKALVAEGDRLVTIDSVHAAAARVGASPHLGNSEKVKWCKSVAELYMREREESGDTPQHDNSVMAALIAAGAWKLGLFG
jgi:hypothetical protein